MNTQTKEKETIDRKEENNFIKVSMPMTPNQTIGRGNDFSYEIMEIYLPTGLMGYRSRVDVRQMYGKRPSEARVLQENPINSYGLFKIQRYDYQPGSEMQILGVAFSSIGAEKLAYKKALKVAREIANDKGLVKVISTIDEDKAKLRQTIADMKKAVN